MTNTSLNVLVSVGVHPSHQPLVAGHMQPPVLYRSELPKIALMRRSTSHPFFLPYLPTSTCMHTDSCWLRLSSKSQQKEKNFNAGQHTFLRGMPASSWPTSVVHALVLHREHWFGFHFWRPPHLSSTFLNAPFTVSLAFAAVRILLSLWGLWALPLGQPPTYGTFWCATVLYVLQHLLLVNRTHSLVILINSVGIVNLSVLEGFKLLYAGWVEILERKAKEYVGICKSVGVFSRGAAAGERAAAVIWPFSFQRLIR